MGEVPLYYLRVAMLRWSFATEGAPGSRAPFYTQRKLSHGFKLSAVHTQGYLANKKTHALGLYRRIMPRVLGGFKRGGRFLMGEITL